MNYWIIVDDKHSGPYTAQQLIDSGIKPETLVWHEGLTDWIAAGSAPELAEGMRQRDMAAAQAEAQAQAQAQAEAARQQQAQQQQQYQQPYQQQQPSYQQHPYAQRNQWAPQQPCSEPCPSTYIAWSIIVTILCCTPLGIAAVIYSTMVKTAYNRGDLQQAKRNSNTAQWLIIISIVVGVISWPFQLASMMGMF
jgi:hypothetical protein